MKKILLITWAVLSYALLAYDTIQFILGKANVMDKIYIGLGYGTLLIIFVVRIIAKTVKEIYTYKKYSQYKEGFKYLKNIHKIRYRLYFTGTREEVQNYSTEIERYGKAFIDLGEYYILEKLFNTKQSQKVEEMISQVKSLMTTDM